jgi:glycerophosphoryl diester phosphodiesterase
MEIVAHRGLTSTVVENTIPAFKMALQQGFGIEVDLRRTSDGEFVVNHDNKLKRKAGVNEAINNLTITELKSIQSNPRDSDTLYEIPTLREVLDVFVATSSADTHLALHLKGDGWDGQVADLLDTIRAYDEDSSLDLFNQIFVFDVTVDTAQRFAAAEPPVSIGLSIGESEHFPTDRNPTIYRYEDVRDLDFWDVVWADEWTGGLYTTEFIRQVRADDRAVICVSPELHAGTDPSHPQHDSPADVWEKLIHLNVDGICTDLGPELRARIT